MVKTATDGVDTHAPQVRSVVRTLLAFGVALFQ